MRVFLVLCVLSPVFSRPVTLRNYAPVHSVSLTTTDLKYKIKTEANSEDTVTLTCAFDILPFIPDKVNDKHNLPDVGTDDLVIFEGMLHSRRGLFTCETVDSLSQNSGTRDLAAGSLPSTTQPSTFIPNAPTVPTMYHHERRTGQRRGRNHQLTCTSTGWPRPGVYWMRNGLQLTNDHKYDVTELNSGRYKKTSTLLIRSISRRDFGEYVCVGQNDLGTREMAVELYDANPSIR